MRNFDSSAAFPSNIQKGMSLRDHFAGLAMQGIWSNEEMIATVISSVGSNKENITKAISAFSYMQADAMIPERAKNYE